MRLSSYFGSLLLVTAVGLFRPDRLVAQGSLVTPQPQTLAALRSPEPLEIALLTPVTPELSAPLPNPGHEETSFAFVQPAGALIIPKERTHKFWDSENRILFAVAGGFAAADFCVTRANLASGGRELNPVTRVLSGSTPGLAANFALETGALIGINYLFHKTGHHKLERISSFVNIGSSASAVAYGLSHR